MLSYAVIFSIIAIIVLPMIILVLPINLTTLPAKMALSDVFDSIRNVNNRISLDINRKNNEILLDRYLKDNYGIALTKTFIIIDATAYNDSNQVYRIDTPFFENGFRIEINNAKHKVVYNNFISKLTKDPKFQHLYSEWVKKQVGIEDEDVELKIAYNQDNLDFKQIKVLSEDYREIFELLGKFEIKTAYIKNVQDVNEYSIKEVATNYYNTLFKTNEVLDNMPYYVILIRDNCNLLEFLKHRSGEYCSCLFENGKFVDYKYYNN